MPHREPIHPLRSVQTTVPLEVTGLVKKGQIIVMGKVPGKRESLHEGTTRQLRVQIDSMNFAHISRRKPEHLIHLLDSCYIHLMRTGALQCLKLTHGGQGGNL
ncbi:hypothetical protein F2P79_020179 [Pimephales promelas]|nr:hypothetical protein F2P79_020179 [Pimephales promelas]